ncbi:MAG: hypothetical protein SNJ29_13870 [Rikenellaceae bacterium]
MNKIVKMYDERLYVLVCRKTDYSNDVSKIAFFLVKKKEWEREVHKHFNLIHTECEGNKIKLYKGAEHIFSTLTYDQKHLYQEY